MPGQGGNPDGQEARPGGATRWGEWRKQQAGTAVSTGAVGWQEGLLGLCPPCFLCMGSPGVPPDQRSWPGAVVWEPQKHPSLGVGGDGTCEVRSWCGPGASRGAPMPAVEQRACGSGNFAAASCLSVASHPQSVSSEVSPGPLSRALPPGRGASGAYRGLSVYVPLRSKLRPERMANQRKELSSIAYTWEGAVAPVPVAPRGGAHGLPRK